MPTRYRARSAAVLGARRRSRLARWALEAHAHLADLDLVAVAQRRQALDALAVEPRPVGAAAILDVPGAATEGEQGVLGRHERIVEHDRVVDVAPERVDRVEGDGCSGLRPALRRADHEQPRQRPSRTGHAGAQVAPQGARDDHEEGVDEQHEADAAVPTG